MPIEPPANIKDVFRETKSVIQSALSPYNLNLKSGGTRDLELGEPVDPATGYWLRPTQVSSKPPRWILQIDEASDPIEARPGRAADGNFFASANTVGYINNRDGSCVAIVFRILGAVKPIGSEAYEFPGWEWLLVLGFSTPLPAGTSGDPLTNFNPRSGTVEYGTNDARRTYDLALVGIVTAPAGPTITVPETGSQINLSYDDATEAIQQYILAGDAGGDVYDGSDPASLQRLGSKFDEILAAAPAPEDAPTSVAADPSLIGIPPATYRQINAALAAGKRHLIFYGPPGTGKTTLAEYVAREVSADPEDADAYTMLTASASWSSQDLIGGYQPLGGGQIGFIPGILLRNFDRPLVIDELNRCPIDKVIGPLFSVLSGQTTTLPYRQDVGDKDSVFYSILPAQPPTRQAHEYAPDPHWRLICTLNTIDKTQLGQISYALSRRFAWIRVGVPEDLEGFVKDWCERKGMGTAQPGASVNLAAAMWHAINSTREIGAAPIIDFIRAVREMSPELDFFAAPDTTGQEILLDGLRMFILPLMDSISLYEAESLAQEISEAWSLNPELAASLRREIREMAA